MEYPPDLASGLIERAILFKREDLIPTIKEKYQKEKLTMAKMSHKMTGILITLEQNLNWMKSFQNLKRKSVQMQTEKLSKTEMVAKDVLIPIKSLVGNTM